MAVLNEILVKLLVFLLLLFVLLCLFACVEVLQDILEFERFLVSLISVIHLIVVAHCVNVVAVLAPQQLLPRLLARPLQGERFELDVLLGVEVLGDLLGAEDLLAPPGGTISGVLAFLEVLSAVRN